MQQGANGQMSHQTYWCNNVTPQTCAWRTYEVLDPIGGASIGSSGDYGTTFQYDAIGRLASNTAAFPGVKTDFTGTATKSYDAENRLSSDAYASWSNSTTGICGKSGASNARSSFTLTYSWGPHGHPVLFSDSSVGIAETLHWDGDQLAFTTNNAGQLDDLKFGTLADYTPRDQTYQNLTFWDRDLFGSIASSHNSSGYGVWTASSPYHNDCILADAPHDSISFSGPTSFGWSVGSQYRYRYNGLLLDFSGDGLTDGFNNTNGVRTLTNENSSWTVPDPYAGIPKAPSTQKAYVYATNNPVANGDSSGFLSKTQQAQLGRYFSRYDWNHGPIACTIFITSAYAQALGIDLQALVSEDYYGPLRGNPLGVLSPLLKGYQRQGFETGHPEWWVPNLHNYFQRVGELHSWTGNSGLEVGDILFVGPRVTIVNAAYPLAESYIDIDHVATVISVNSKGEILEIVEGTGADAKRKSWKEFLQAMQA
jgi:hypothetical protein